MAARRRVVSLVFLSLILTSCSSSPTTWDLAQGAIAAMGGAAGIEGIETVVMSGGVGTRQRLGQSLELGGPEQDGTLSMVETTIDFARQRAAYEYDVALASGFMQHRLEVLTEHEGQAVGYSINNNGQMASTPGGLFGWGPQNSPAMILRRDPVAILLDAARPGAGGDPVEEVDLNGNLRLHGTTTTSWGEETGLYFDPETHLLVAFDVLDTEPMLGDVQAQYSIGDYQQSGGVLLPHRMTILKGGTPFSDVRYESIAVNSPDADAVFGIPDPLVDQAGRAASSENYVPLTWSPVADGVFHVVAYSHHSMVVEFPTFVAVVEAPYTETQSLALRDLVAEQIPGKPIRYAAVTHPHWDHIGGIRGIAGAGATILVASGHENQIREVLNAPHTNPPDALEQARDSGTAGSIEIYDRMWSASEGDRSLALYEVSGSPHAERVVLAYVPDSGVLFQSDLFFPGTGGAGSPATEHLQEAIRELGLGVRTMVGGHGGVGPFSELVAANAGN